MIGLTGEKLILPFYHAVSDNPPAHLINLYEARSAVDFEKDLDYLLEHFKPIGLQELIKLNKNGLIPKEPSFHITFDDGLVEVYDVVVPILIKRRVPATFFINTDFIDNKKMFYRFKASILVEQLAANGMLDLNCNEENDIDGFAKTLGINFEDYLEKEQPYLTTNQINELIEKGFTIGAHSKNHPLYKLISEKEQIEQTLGSLEVLKKQFRLDYSVFSFPFTDDGVTQSFFKTIQSKVDLTFGSAGLKKDTVEFNLQRIPMENTASTEELIKTQYLYCLLKKLVGKNKVVRL
ncbi:MAG: polysaccharide deacetylase family protein [Flavobacteriales bacterium]